MCCSFALSVQRAASASVLHRLEGGEQGRRAEVWRQDREEAATIQRRDGKEGVVTGGEGRRDGKEGVMTGGEGRREVEKTNSYERK